MPRRTPQWNRPNDWPSFAPRSVGCGRRSKKCFLLRQNAELSYDEIARTIGIPLGTVKTRMRLALANLRAALGATSNK